MIFFGHITPAGILELDHPELYGDLLKGRLANCRVQLDIDRKKIPRSHQQNAYLWAAVYPVIAEHTGNSIPEIHEVCKQMFLPPRQMSIGDGIVTVAGSTARLTTAEMMDYIDRVIALAGELGCVVQTPEEAGFISNSKPPVTAMRERPKEWEVVCKVCFSGLIMSDEEVVRRLDRSENLWPNHCGQVMSLRHIMTALSKEDCDMDRVQGRPWHQVEADPRGRISSMAS
jgi:hypothetical protein